MGSGKPMGFGWLTTLPPRLGFYAFESRSTLADPRLQERNAESITPCSVPCNQGSGPASYGRLSNLEDYAISNILNQESV